MSTTNLPPRRVGRLASAIGGVGLTGIVSISLFYMFGGIFGPLNDICNALGAMLSAGLAWWLHPWQSTQPPRLGRLTLGAAWLGALLAVLGSVLVLSRRTGWYLAGLYTTLGYALIGVWLWQFSAATARAQCWPRRLAQFGRVAGAAMTVGLLAIPGILRGVDAGGGAPWWANVGYLGGLGWFLLYPIWCLWVGRALSRPGAARPESTPEMPAVKA